jgi:arylsulfatase A-like enzyme
MNLLSALASVAAISVASFGSGSNAEEWVSQKPNVVYILCDDLGYGDVQSLNPTRGKIPTPNIDRLAAQGMIFRDAHSASAVCTPSRYSILTGRYNWRTHLQKGVLFGMSEPLIAKDRMTVAEMLKANGYSTACVGKWHLGLDFGKDPLKDPIVDGPLQHGFDEFFGISASLDMPPYAFIEGDRFTEELTATKKWVREGPAAPSFEAIDVLPALAKRATHFISSHKPQPGKQTKPFFVYLPLNSPHTPILPTKEWEGKSGVGPYGDFVMQTDAVVGEVMQAIDDAGLTDSTLLVFTSDNGCSPAAQVDDLERQGHFPSAQFRGYKADIWDGGHRIPYIVRWPNAVKAGSVSDQTVGQIDLFATMCEILGVQKPDNAAEDSVSILPVLRGVATGPVREAEVHHSIGGHFAIRQGPWKLELCAGSGGWAHPNEKQAHAQNLPPVQLYNLDDDIGETNNVHAQHPEIVERLTRLLEKYIAEGRSTPGAKQKNDVEIDLWKTSVPDAQKR